jgi:hypothetical protein
MEKAMRNLIGIACLALCLNAASLPAFSQLRNFSEYSQDCINKEKTYFLLQEKAGADFGWASEWTHTTANAHPEKAAMFLWHFKDGSKAYTRQGDLLGDAGQATGYLLCDQSATLEDASRKKVQPMSKANYPVKVELWIGEIGDSSGFSPETLVDSACFNAQSIEYNRRYNFADCE